MFETKRSAIKKIFKEIDKAFPKDVAIIKKREHLKSLEDIALATNNEKDLDLFNELSLAINKEEAQYQYEQGIRPHKP